MTAGHLASDNGRFQGQPGVLILSAPGKDGRPSGAAVVCTQAAGESATFDPTSSTAFNSTPAVPDGHPPPFRGIPSVLLRMKTLSWACFPMLPTEL